MEITFKSRKSKILRLGRKHPNHTYYMEDDNSKVELKGVSMEKDLEVIIDFILFFYFLQKFIEGNLVSQG